MIPGGLNIRKIYIIIIIIITTTTTTTNTTTAIFFGTFKEAGRTWSDPQKNRPDNWKQKVAEVIVTAACMMVLICRLN